MPDVAAESVPFRHVTRGSGHRGMVRQARNDVVTRLGVEPRTPGLQVACGTGLPVVTGSPKAGVSQASRVPSFSLGLLLRTRPLGGVPNGGSANSNPVRLYDGEAAGKLSQISLTDELLLPLITKRRFQDTQPAQTGTVEAPR